MQKQYYPVKFAYRTFPLISNIEKQEKDNNISLELAEFWKIDKFENDNNFNLLF